MRGVVVMQRQYLKNVILFDESVYQLLKESPYYSHIYTFEWFDTGADTI